MALALGLFKKGTLGIIAKFHMTDLVIWGHSRNGKILSYGRTITIDQVFYFYHFGSNLTRNNQYNCLFSKPYMFVLSTYCKLPFSAFHMLRYDT